MLAQVVSDDVGGCIRRQILLLSSDYVFFGLCTSTHVVCDGVDGLNYYLIYIYFFTYLFNLITF